MWKNLLLLVASAAISLISADVALEWLMRDPAFWRARELGVPYDTRDRLDVIVANRKDDPNWYPAVPANTYLEHELQVGGARIIPLGGVANAKVVGCNEAGYYSSFATDEAGFHNPRGTWPLSRPSHIFLLGDSFTQGDCVRDGDGIAEQLRKMHPEVVNLGVGGNGPLLELAGIREYVPSGRVSYVFWLYYEGNDLLDLRRDSTNALLLRYLDPAFTQDLMSRQAIVNEVVRDFVERRTLERLRGRSVVLPGLREAIWRARNGQPVLPRRSRAAEEADATQTSNVSGFLRVISQAKSDVAQKGGELIFVNLPEHYRLVGQPLSGDARQKASVLQGVGQLGVKVLDMEPILRRHPSPEDLFPLGIKAHYNSIGYRLIAEELEKFIAAPAVSPKH